MDTQNRKSIDVQFKKPVVYRYKGASMAVMSERDKMHLRECFSVYRYLYVDKRSVVMDLGAHIGDSSVFFAHSGATVHAFEPDPRNFRLLDMNAKLYNSITVYKVAVVNAAYQGDTVTLYQDRVQRITNSIINPIRGRSSVTVPVLRFTELVQQIQPTAIKMNIEGYEYELVDEVLAIVETLESLTMEFNYKEDRRRKEAKTFDMAVRKKGFAAIVPVKYTNPGEWNRCMATWVRKDIGEKWL